MTRNYIFEDNRKDDLQQLFSVAYGGPNNIPNNLIWAEGSSKIVSVLTDIYLPYGINAEDIIEAIENGRLSDNNREEYEKKLRVLFGKIENYIFMDLVPDNPYTADIYNRLKKLRKIGFNLIVFPLPCSEYYSIKMLCSIGVIKRDDIIETLLNRDVHYGSNIQSLIENKDSKQKAINFERFCKLAFLTLKMQCLHKSAEGDRKADYLKGRFYRKGCNLCSECYLDITLEIKSRELLKSYGFFPENPILPFYTKIRKLTRIECIELHKHLVDEYNAAVAKYKAYTGPRVIYPLPKIKEYKEIDYFE